MHDRLRVGIVGGGNITVSGHVPVLRALPEIVVAGVAEPVESRRTMVQELLGLPDSACFADSRELLASGVDYVVLAVPPHVRAAIVADCARAGVHVLSEKPIATVPAEGHAMIELMRAANLRYGMVHNYLYYPEYELARELVGKGELGSLRHVTLNFLGVPDNLGAVDYRPRWRHDPEEAGGGILMDMIHALYVAEFLMGGPVRAVQAIADNLDRRGDPVEDFVQVQLFFDSGYATVGLWWGGGPGGVELAGTAGRIMIFYEDYATGPFAPLDSFTLVNQRGRQRFDPRGPDFRPQNFARIHADFARAVRDGSEPIAPAEVGLRSLESALAAYMSAALGRVVELPLAADHPVYRAGVLGLRQLNVWSGSPLVRHGVFGLGAPLSSTAAGDPG